MRRCPGPHCRPNSWTPARGHPGAPAAPAPLGPAPASRDPGPVLPLARAELPAAAASRAPGQQIKGRPGYSPAPGGGQAALRLPRPRPPPAAGPSPLLELGAVTASGRRSVLGPPVVTVLTRDKEAQTAEVVVQVPGLCRGAAEAPPDLSHFRMTGTTSSSFRAWPTWRQWEAA